MLSSSNYFLLISLAIVSWVLLCLSNSKTPYTKFTKEQATKSTSGKTELVNWPQAIFYSVSSVNSGIMIYIACTLLGIFIIVNIAKRKISTLGLVEPLAIFESKIVSLKHQMQRLKTEKNGLLNLLSQYKLEKKFLIQHVNFNTTIIQKLRAELKLAKEQLDIFKCKFYMISNNKFVEQCYDMIPKEDKMKVSETNCISSAYIVNHYFRSQNEKKYLKNMNNYDSLRLTASNHDVINKILKEAYDNTGSTNNSKSNLKTILTSMNSECPFNRKSSQSEKADLMGNIQGSGVNIVSTHQLEIIKGLSVKSDPFYQNMHMQRSIEQYNTQ